MIYVLLGTIHLLVNFLREMARFSMTHFCNDFDRPCIIQYKYEVKCFKHTRFCQEFSEVKIMAREICLLFGQNLLKVFNGNICIASLTLFRPYAFSSNFDTAKSK